MPFYNKKPASTPAPANSGASAKTLGFFTGIITIVLGINTLVVGCSNRKIEEEKSHREYIQAEEDFWHEKYSELSEILRADADGNEKMYKLRMLYIISKFHSFDHLRAGVGESSETTRAFDSLYIMFLSTFERESDILSKEEFKSLESLQFYFSADDGIGQFSGSTRRRLENMTRELVTSGIVNRLPSDSPLVDVTSLPVPPSGPQVPSTESRPSSVILAQGRDVGYDFDIFWCDATDDAVAQRNYDEALGSGNALAAMVNANSRLAGQSIGRVRVRVLPTERQGRGYPSPTDPRTQGLSIRPDSSFETEKAIASDLLTREPWKSAGYQPLLGSSASQWYISLFVCYAPPTPAAPSR